MWASVAADPTLRAQAQECSTWSSVALRHMGSSWAGIKPVRHIAMQILNHWTTRGAPDISSCKWWSPGCGGWSEERPCNLERFLYILHSSRVSCKHGKYLPSPCALVFHSLNFPHYFKVVKACHSFPLGLVLACLKKSSLAQRHEACSVCLLRAYWFSFLHPRFITIWQ